MLSTLTKEIVDKANPLYLDLVNIVSSWMKENDDASGFCAIYAISMLATHISYCCDEPISALDTISYIARKRLDSSLISKK